MPLAFSLIQTEDEEDFALGLRLPGNPGQNTFFLLSH